MGSAERSAPRMKFFSRRNPRVDEVQALYQLHGPGLLLYACSLLGRKHAAEDLLQQVFTKLLEHNTIPEDARPYLFRAVHNVALNLIRSERKNVGLADIEPWFEAPEQDHAARVTLTIELTRIPEDQRQVLVLHVWGGLSFEEIASVLAVSPNTAASRYRYALQKLRVSMQSKDPLCR
jgi:RNA polymerase sigma-70 factor (ECF subfamily)